MLHDWVFYYFFEVHLSCFLRSVAPIPPSSGKRFVGRKSHRYSCLCVPSERLVPGGFHSIISVVCMSFVFHFFSWQKKWSKKVKCRPTLRWRPKPAHNSQSLLATIIHYLFHLSFMSTGITKDSFNRMLFYWLIVVSYWRRCIPCRFLYSTVML